MWIVVKLYSLVNNDKKSLEQFRIDTFFPNTLDESKDRKLSEPEGWLSYRTV